MMRIGLYKLESKLKNFALEKVRLYYLQSGANVEDYLPLAHSSYDEVWCSSIFDYTSKATVPPDAICGGTGFDLETKLPDKINAMKPRLNYGFTTRGCTRNCSFCVVPKSEGELRVVGDLLDLWDGKAKDVVLYDNNILGDVGHFNLVCNQAIENGIRLDFNQGLDYRLLTQNIVEVLKTMRHIEYRFSFDHIEMKDGVGRAIDLLQKNDIKRCMWFVLVGYNTTIKEDLIRLNFLKEHNQNAYVMRFRKNGKCSRELIPLARWANQHHIFQGMTYEQFLSRS